MRRGPIGGVALVVLLALGAGFVLYRPTPVTPMRQTKPPPPKPTLYCDFYNFMHNATIASFYFSVENASGADPKYSELYVVENEGQKTEFGGLDQPPPPQWVYKVEDGTPIIASPDDATRIVLYGLKPKAGGVFWVEAGVRSNSYRNLEGKCRQAHYATSATADFGPRP